MIFINKDILTNIGKVALMAIAGTLLTTHSFAASNPELDAALKKIMPAATADNIEETGLPGIYEVTYGSSIFYFNKKATLMFRGDIIDIEKRVNLTEEKRNTVRGKLLKSVDESKMIVYPAKNEKAKVTVFTDIDCSYCQKLHREMDAYNAEGITIRYMAYPRAGLGTSSYQKLVNVWCADSPTKAMDKAKSGVALAEKNCTNPVADHYKLGQQLGLQGTPAMFLEDGLSMPGYMPAKRLAQEIYSK